LYTSARLLAADSTFWRFVNARQHDEHKPCAGEPHTETLVELISDKGLYRGALKMIATVGLKEIGPIGQFACAGSYAEVVTPGVVYRGGLVRIERVQPRQGALAATIAMMAPALAAASSS
jgi:hypothetical protein